MEVKGIRHEAFNCEKYVSGKSMEDVMADYGLTSVVKLGSNENMYGPYDVALNAMGEEVKKLNIYPEKNYIKLIQCTSKYAELILYNFFSLYLTLLMKHWYFLFHQRY